MINFLKNLFISKEIKILIDEIDKVEDKIKSKLKYLILLLHAVDLNLTIFKRYDDLDLEFENKLRSKKETQDLNKTLDLKKILALNLHVYLYNLLWDLEKILDRALKLEKDIKELIFSQRKEEWEEIFLSLPEGESLAFICVEDKSLYIWYKKIEDNKFEKCEKLINNMHDQGVFPSYYGGVNFEYKGVFYDQVFLSFDQVIASSSRYLLDSILGIRNFEII